MKDIAIYGAGGFGREVACLLRKINEQTSQWNLIGFFDDGKECGYSTEYGDVLGGIEQLNSFSSSLSIVTEVVELIPSLINTFFIVINNISISSRKEQ